jgi:ABC-type branched-subunit amino acid transport system substrate-binding protein
MIKFPGSLVSLIIFGGICFSQPARAADVVFAQIASVTNPASVANAQGLAVGIRACFDALNARGGVNGHKLKLDLRDDGLNGPKMVEITDELIKQPSIVGLLGFLNTAGITALSKQNAFAKGGIAMIAPLQGDKAIVETENVFPLRSGYGDEIDTLLKEAKNWGKDTISIVNMNIAFGPILAEVAQKRATELGIKIVSRSVVTFSPDTQPATVLEAVKAVNAAQPKAILVLAAGTPAFEFIKAVRGTPGGLAQIYGLSVLLHGELVKTMGVDKARGIVLSQATPYPFQPSRAVINEYQAAMKAHAPKEVLSFSSLEGFLGAKIAAEAVRRSGPKPDREHVLAALKNLGEYNLGGLWVNYTPQARKGWGGVDLTIINADGNLQK